MRGYIVLKPGDIWQFKDIEGTIMHYLVLSYYEHDGWVRVKEMETGFLEEWLNPFQPVHGKWKRVG